MTPTRRQGTVLGYISYRDYLQFRDRNKTLQGLAAHYSTAPLFVSVDNNAREVNDASVTANFFPRNDDVTVLSVVPPLSRRERPEPHIEGPARIGFLLQASDSHD